MLNRSREIQENNGSKSNQSCCQCDPVDRNGAVFKYYEIRQYFHYENTTFQVGKKKEPPLNERGSLTKSLQLSVTELP